MTPESLNVKSCRGRLTYIENIEEARLKFKRAKVIRGASRYRTLRKLEENF